jgi:hypothetical protein
VVKFKKLLAQNNKEMEELKKDNKSLLKAIVYELNNHEYCYTGDVEPALSALNLKIEDVPSDILKKATKLAYKEA